LVSQFDDGLGIAGVVSCFTSSGEIGIGENRVRDSKADGIAREEGIAPNDAAVDVLLDHCDVLRGGDATPQKAVQTGAAVATIDEALIHHDIDNAESVLLASVYEGFEVPGVEVATERDLRRSEVGSNFSEQGDTSRASPAPVEPMVVLVSGTGVTGVETELGVNGVGCLKLDNGPRSS